MITCNLATGIGIHVTADSLDEFYNFLCVSGFGSLKKHMFKHVRRAMIIDGFIATSGAKPNAKRNTTDAFSAISNDAKPAGQSVKADISHDVLFL